MHGKIGAVESFISFPFSVPGAGKMILVFFIISGIFVLVRTKPLSDNCEKDFCVRNLTQCANGFVPDDRNCCPQGLCLLAEGTRCYKLDSSLIKISETNLEYYGICGNSLECLNTNTQSELETVCTCTSPGEVCGSDLKTYPSMCSFNEAQTKHREPDSLQILKLGPCNVIPTISSEPSDMILLEKENLALNCEVHGYPLPHITWTFQALDQLVKKLPGDDSKIVVQLQGGPERHMITSWLQIIEVTNKNEGVYTCTASNTEGIAHAIAEVKIDKA